MAGSCLRHSDSEESRSGAPGCSRRTRSRRSRKSVRALVLGVHYQPISALTRACPLARPRGSPARSGPHAPLHAVVRGDSGGCFAPPARLRGGATVESVVVAIRAGRNPRDVRGVGEHLVGASELRQVRRVARLVDGVLAPSWNRTVVGCVFPSRARPAGDVRGPRRLKSGLGGLVRYVRVGGGRCGITAGPAT